MTRLLAALTVVVVLSTVPGSLAATDGRGAPPPAAGIANDRVDYLQDDFIVQRVLDWGDRPDWSPDGKKVAFTEADSEDGFAYELDLQTGKVRCLTCRWGTTGLVTRIYYLPDSSFLIEAGADLENSSSESGGGSGAGVLTTELYWMPASLSLPPQPLNSPAFGEVAISPNVTREGAFRIAWGSLDNAASRIRIAELVHDGRIAVLYNRRVVYEFPSLAAIGSQSGPTVVETYNFSKNDEALTFLSIEPPLNAEMFELNLRTGSIVNLSQDPAHNEVHLFPNEQFGLEESNRASDPNGPARGISGVATSTFDLFVVAFDGSRRVRRLTFVSDLGGQAHQSAPAPDGRRVVYALHPPASGPLAGLGGLYVGEFVRER